MGNLYVAIWAGQRRALTLFSTARIDVRLFAEHIRAMYFMSIVFHNVSNGTLHHGAHAIFSTTCVQIIDSALVTCTVRNVVVWLVAETMWAEVLVTGGQLDAASQQVSSLGALSALAPDLLIVVD